MQQHEGGGGRGGGTGPGGGGPGSPAVPHEGQDYPGYRRAIAVLLTPVRLLFRHEWHHPERIPREGGVLVVANHISVVDPLVLATFVHDQGRMVHFLAKEGLFRMPIIGPLLRGARQIPVHRGTPDAPLALRDARAALEAGGCVVIYPEGTVTRDPDRWPMVARTGVARLALETGVPVVPVGQWGAQRVRPRLGRGGPRPLMRLSAGEPVDLSAWRGRPLDAAVLREATGAVMAAISAELVGLRPGTPPAEPFDPRPLRAVPREGERSGPGDDDGGDDRGDGDGDRGEGDRGEGARGGA